MARLLTCLLVADTAHLAMYLPCQQFWRKLEIAAVANDVANDDDSR